MILFSCPLPTVRVPQNAGMGVERVNATTLTPGDYKSILEAWNPSLRAQQIPERFAAGAELWLIKTDAQLSGFGWTLQGRTLEPYFFPIQPQDVHLFDFFVFPNFRGRGINAALVMHILSRLAGEGIRRAYIECAAWNQAQLRSLKKTDFQRYASASKFRFLGHGVVIWHRDESE
jgi:GNAT superfamily N-acetyltransferase